MVISPCAWTLVGRGAAISASLSARMAFYRVVFCKKVYGSIDLQSDLDDWVKSYNEKAAPGTMGLRQNADAYVP